MPDLQTSLASLMTELRKNLKEAVDEVFGTTFGVRPETIPPDGSAKGVSAIIGLSGNFTGYLAVHVNPEGACNIAGNMLGDSYPEVDDIVCDAVGELANMLGGSLKKYSCRSGELFRISTPTIVQGRDYSTHTPKGAEQILLGVSAISSLLTVQLVINESH
ncbi:MAG: chemotaxis protein CheX [Acidobacteriota bacterium]|jgi:chemotaxis protein CheX|nr:chemotaxis protein CheX [Acidobacteriota bacterium]